MSGKASPEVLLATYLGRDVARRVLSGETSRGQGRLVRAGIFYADLKGFTALTDRLPAEQVIGHLNDYFDIVATSILEHNGEVLKFIGDGLLAAFNIDGKSPASACCQALHAGLNAIEGLAKANQDRALPLEAGMALHYGDVVYGNIGTEARLDFTVIGAAVNEATRIEALCRTLSRPLLISADFAKVCTCHPLVSLGYHRLRGVGEPQEIFTPTPAGAIARASPARPCERKDHQAREELCHGPLSSDLIDSETRSSLRQAAEISSKSSAFGQNTRGAFLAKPHASQTRHLFNLRQ